FNGGSVSGFVGSNYTYDALNRLIGTSHDHFDPNNGHDVVDYAVSYTYDAQNRRTSRTAHDSAGHAYTTDYVYDGLNMIGEIDAATGLLMRSYTWDPTKE